MALRVSGSRGRALRALLSLLAGGGLSTVGAGGVFSAQAAGSQTRSTASGDSAMPITVTESGSESGAAQGEAAPGSQSTHTTTGSTTLTPPASSTTTGTTGTSATPPPRTTTAEEIVVATPPSSTTATTPPAVVHQREQKATSGQGQTSTAAGKGARGAAALGANNVAPPPQLLAAQAGVLAAELAGSAASVQSLSYYRIPLFLLPIYQAAAAQYGVPWQILAAINEVETDYGSDLSVSTAGAVGWMQFMPATWIQYGVDALNAGYADPYNPVDAIFAAARYLRAAGASSNLRAAILAYNHSAEYVSSVLLRAKLISQYPNAVIQTLTGLTDGRLPVRNNRVACDSIAHLLSPSSATKATAVSHAEAETLPGEAAPGSSSTLQSSLAPAPGAAAKVARAAGASPRQPLQLADLLTVPNATVVSVQDGRIVKLGSSPRLGRYVVLRDVYGDVFTYAGLGSIVRSYRTPKKPRIAGITGAAALSAKAPEATPPQGPHASRGQPLTLNVTLPASKHRTAAPRQVHHSAPPVRTTAGDRARSAAPALGQTLPRLFPFGGRSPLFAELGKSRARQAAAHRGAARPAKAAAGLAPLRVGSIVAKGAVLGHVSTPTGARAGHMRFAIRPAGDLGTIDPRPILRNWSQLNMALHPRGASGETDLLGATASGVFLLSKSDLQRDVLSDPGISIYACGRHDIASGAIDKRVLALLAFLSRSGLKPTVSALRCGLGEVTSGSASDYQGGIAVDISAIDGIPIAAHQGSGTVTDVTIRTLLTLRRQFAPYRIVSLMQYPGAESTLAVAEDWSHIHIAFRPLARAPHLSAHLPASAHSAHAARIAPAPLLVTGSLSSRQWDQLVTHIGKLVVPTIAAKPSGAAVKDPQRP
jgi:soluble lytic murein transglycosylase-like protein